MRSQSVLPIDGLVRPAPIKMELNIKYCKYET